MMCSPVRSAPVVIGVLLEGVVDVNGSCVYAEPVCNLCLHGAALHKSTPHVCRGVDLAYFSLPYTKEAHHFRVRVANAVA